MLQFTKNDIPYIKDTLAKIFARVYAGTFDFSKYIEKKLITVEERIAIIACTKRLYPAFPFEPVPQELRPLIKIAQEILTDERTSLTKSKSRINRTPSFYGYDDDYLGRYRPTTTWDSYDEYGA